MKTSPLLLLLTSCLLPLPVIGATIEVAPGSEQSASKKTLAAAVAAAAPGDRIVLSPGVYYEAVTVSCRGTESAPIIIESADPANPAIISGADVIRDWKPVAGSDLPEANHPEAAELVYAEVDWVPVQLYVGSGKMPVARTPDSGWWTAASDGKTIQSPSLAEVRAESLEGAEVFFILMKTVRQELAKVGGWEKGGAITLDAPLFKGESAPYGSGDRFYIQNHTAFLDRPGEWVAQKTSAGARLIFWPPSAGAVVEAPRRETVVDMTGASDVVLRGLEVRHAAKSPGGFGIGSKAGADGGRRIVIENCAVYQNGRFGISLNGFSDSAVRRCLVADNSYGLAVGRSRGVAIEENEIAWNENDGLTVTYGSEAVVIRRNAIHHHSRFAHPDNFQTYRGVKNVTLDSNVLAAAGQGAHMQETSDLIARNNIVAGSSANLFIIGKGGTTSGFQLERNTFALYPEGGVVVDGEGHRFDGNLFDIGGGKNGYSGKAKSEAFSSTNNLFWKSGQGALVTFSQGGYKAFDSLPPLQASTGLEAGSVMENPGFPSAPLSAARLDPNRMAECTAAWLVLDPRDGSGIAVGDHVEFDFDGVDRIVKSVSNGGITVEPPLRDAPITSVTVLNWKSRPVGPIDLRSKSGRGSNVDFEAFMRGDFNGDGKRDIPAWPGGIQAPRVGPQACRKSPQILNSWHS